MSVLPMTYWSISSEILTKTAQELGLRVEILCEAKNFFSISNQEKTMYFKSTDFGGNTALSKKITDDKELTYILLEKIGIPTARTAYIDQHNTENLENHIKHLVFPVIIKPIDESHGNGVIMHIQDIDELKEKCKVHLSKYSRIIIQTEIQGDEARFFVLKGEVLVAYKRMPPRITGDGVSSIGELIDRENTTNPLRGEGYMSPLSYIKMDSECERYINNSGYTLSSILPADEILILRGNSNVGTGGTIEEITNIIHPSIRQHCQEISKSFGMEICGIDIIASDFSRPLEETNGIILEINATPGIGGHKELTSVYTGKVILEKLFGL